MKSKFECGAIFGSTGPHVNLTISDSKNRIENQEITVDKNYLLTGERYVLPKIDGGEEYIQAIAKKYNISTNEVTEAMVMEDLYQKNSANTKIFKNIPYKVVDTPKENMTRPNTWTTIVKFLENLELGECNSILYIGRAPYIIAQEEDVRKAMYMYSPKRQFEVVGGEAKVSEVASEDSAAYHITMAIAGKFYGGYEMVVNKLNDKYRMCSSIDYLINYKKVSFSKKYKIVGSKKVELHNTKLN